MRAAKDVVWIMDEFFDRFQMLRIAQRYPIESTWNPPTDIFDMGDHIHIKIEIAGINPKDVSITLNRNILTVKGSRIEDETVKMRVLQMEILYGYFERQFILPSSVDPNRASAYYQRGMLEINLPKSDTDSNSLSKIMIIIS
jgi:HSP20 family protein